MSDLRRETSTVAPSGERLEQLPDGVSFRDAVTHVDDRGSVCEVFDPRWSWSERAMAAPIDHRPVCRRETSTVVASPVRSR